MHQTIQQQRNSHVARAARQHTQRTPHPYPNLMLRGTRRVLAQTKKSSPDRRSLAARLWERNQKGASLPVLTVPVLISCTGTGTPGQLITPSFYASAERSHPQPLAASRRLRPIFAPRRSIPAYHLRRFIRRTLRPLSEHIGWLQGCFLSSAVPPIDDASGHSYNRQSHLHTRILPLLLFRTKIRSSKAWVGPPSALAEGWKVGHLT
jgi:hypothetical protein